ncbi:MAG: VOC family protein [Novosphingobium sp.]
MPVRSLDHVNIRTPDVMGTAAFLQDLLDLDPRIAPGAESIAQGCWMYDLGNRPIIHIAAQDSAYPSDGMMPFVAAPGTGALHHVALECTDRDATLARIEAAGHAVATSDISQVGLRQLFVAEPNGILLELNFFE